MGHSTLWNSGGIYLNHGGDFKNQSVITNSGLIKVFGGTLDIEVDVANAGGSLFVASGSRMTLAGSTITDGAIHNDGVVEIVDDSILYSVSMSNSWLTVDAGKTLTLNGSSIGNGVVENDGTIHVTGDGHIDLALLLNGQTT